MQIGDTLTMAEYNKIIYLLRHNAEVSNDIRLSDEEIITDMFKMTVSFDDGVYTDDGVIINNTTGITLTINLYDKLLHFGIPYLKVTCYEVDNYHDNLDLSRVKRVEKIKRLYNTTSYHINGLSNDKVLILGYDAEVYWDLANSDYEYIKGLLLEAEPAIVVDGEDSVLSSQVVSSVNKPLNRQATVKFYELFDYASLKMKVDKALIDDTEDSTMEFMVLDSDGSRVSGVDVKVYEITED